MQERTIKAHKRRTKSGKIVTVRSHTASYACDSISKKSNGDELKSRKNLKRPIGSGTNGPERKPKVQKKNSKPYWTLVSDFLRGAQ